MLNNAIATISAHSFLCTIISWCAYTVMILVPKDRNVMAKGLRSAQQVSGSSHDMHLL